MAKKKKSKASGFVVRLIVFIVLPLVLFMISAWLIQRTITQGGKQMHEAYDVSHGEAADRAYNGIYQISYNNAERKNHVRNRVIITVGDTEEKSDLEVLSVSDVVFIIRQDGNHVNGKATWAEYPGTGTFTVNLKDAEFVVDNERNHVLARVPEPELARCDIQFGNAKLLLKEGKGIAKLFNGTTVEGEKEADRDAKEAQKKLRKEFLENTRYLSAAEDSAVSLVTESIKGLNADNPDLMVDVEFTDNFT